MLKKFLLKFLPCVVGFYNHRKIVRQTQAYSNLICNKFRKMRLPSSNNWQKSEQSYSNLVDRRHQQTKQLQSVSCYRKKKKFVLME